MTRIVAVLVDLVLGAAALGLSAAALLVQQRSQLATEYLLVVLPAAAIPLVTAWRARGRTLPPWATLLAVAAPLAGAMGSLAVAERSMALLPISLLVVAASGVGAYSARSAAAGRARGLARWRAVPLALVSAGLAAALVPATLSRLLTRPAGTPAPQVALTLLDGSEVTTGALAGRVVVLSFWSPHCGPCVLEMPELEAVARAHRGTSDAMFLAVDSAGGDERREDVEAFVARHGLTLPVSFEPDGAAARAFGVEGLPTTVVIDRAGTIRYRRIGYSAAAGYAAWLTGVVAELSRTPPAIRSARGPAAGG